MTKYYELNSEEIIEDNSTYLHPNTSGNRGFTDYRNHNSMYGKNFNSNEIRNKLQNKGYADKEFKNFFNKFRNFRCDKSQDRQCGTNIIKYFNDYRHNKCIDNIEKFDNSQKYYKKKSICPSGYIRTLVDKKKKKFKCVKIDYYKKLKKCTNKCKNLKKKCINCSDRLDCYDKCYSSLPQNFCNPLNYPNKFNGCKKCYFCNKKNKCYHCDTKN